LPDIASLLLELGYFPASELVVIRKVLDAIRKGVDHFGEPITSILFQYVSNTYGLTENELIAKIGLLEKSIDALFGDSSKSVIDSIKLHLMPHSKLYDPDLTLQEIINELRRIEATDFIHNRTGHEHVAFFYTSSAAKDKMLAEFFEPSASSPYALKAIISLDTTGKPKYRGVKNISYNEFLKVEKEKAMAEMFRWIGEIHKSNLSGRETRVAGEDASWFFRNGFENEFLSAEEEIGRQVRDRISVLCSYDLGNMQNKEQLKRIIQSHGYVVIDEPLTVYRAEKIPQ